jgi:LETM1 and EF-hand domain-containing protein 1
VKKATLWEKAKAEIHHMYIGSKLLYMNIRASVSIVRKLLFQGTNAVSRRERRHLSRVVRDLYRLVPFSILMIIPLLEFSIPFLIKLFPNMLPSTFATKSQQEASIRKQIQARLGVARFLQDTVLAKQPSDTAELSALLAQIRSGTSTHDEAERAQASLRLARLFKDDFTLDNLSREQLLATCRMLGLKPYGTNAFLRWQLTREVDKLRRDDEEIAREGGVATLTYDEVKVACLERGMRSVYRSAKYRERHLREQLEDWLTLSIEKRVPIGVLLLTRAFMFTQEPLEKQLAHTLKEMPELVAAEAELDLAVDKYARRQLALELTQAELAAMEQEKQDQLDTDTEIATEQVAEFERKGGAAAKRLEDVAAAVEVASGASSALSEEMGQIKEAKAALESAERAAAAEAAEVEAAVNAAAEAAAAAVAAEAAAAAGTTPVAASDVAEAVKEPTVAEVEAATKGAADHDVTPPKVVETATPPAPVDATPSLPDAPEPPAAAKAEELPYQSSIEKLLADIEAEANEKEALLAQMTRIIDEDNDGVVSTDELRVAISLLDGEIADDELNALIEKLDLDRDGKVAIQEMKLIVEALNEAFEKRELALKAKRARAAENYSSDKDRND